MTYPVLTATAHDTTGTGAGVVLPRRRDVSLLLGLNEAGSGTLSVWLDDPLLADHPGLLDYGKVIKVALAGVGTIGAWKIETRDSSVISPAEGAGRLLTVSGRGLLGVLDEATVWPAAGALDGGAIGRLTPDERHFGWMSPPGAWYDAGDWATPVGVAKSALARKAGFPVGWPDPAAQWLWASPGPNVVVGPGRCLFRRQLTLASATAVRIVATGDDKLRLFLDEALVIETGDEYAWQATYAYTTELAAGTHTIGAEVVNAYRISTATNVGGFLCVVINAETGAVIARTDTTHWKVHEDTGAVPGPSAAEILVRLLTEAQDRSVTSLTGLDLDFTAGLDSSGAAWTDQQERGFAVGTDLANVAAQLTELAFDLQLGADLVLRAYRHLGTDRSATVALEAGNVLRYDLQEGGPKPRTDVLLRSAAGWSRRVNTAGIAAYGRIEGYISTGLSLSEGQAGRVSDAVLPSLSTTEITATAVLGSVAGIVPLTDFWLGDVVSAMDADGSPLDLTVGSIAAAENEAGTAVEWTVELIRGAP